ncbi:MAG: RNA methyltransferase, partial [Bartonella sp.]|nr:RNA methyltransferase [Bartonella sp.]
TIPRVVAISCNPVTFARDVSLLVAGGYTIEKVIPIDQFLWSPHIEIVATLSKRKTKKSWKL